MKTEHTPRGFDPKIESAECPERSEGAIAAIDQKSVSQCPGRDLNPHDP